ncbi:MAG: hypothetical protein GY805_13075 [Chloroflexi bacterium]|nr:hypothetical protein [Chloroflexota bacterium]
MGWAKEKRPFRPHITLGRVKNSRKVQQMNWGVELESLKVEITAVHLMQSELRPFGAVYTVKHNANLVQE